MCGDKGAVTPVRCEQYFHGMGGRCSAVGWETNDFHRTGSRPQNALSDAPKQEPPDGAMAVRSHQDQVCSPLYSVGGNGLARIPDKDLGAHILTSPNESLGPCLDDFFTFRLCT